MNTSNPSTPLGSRRGGWLPKDHALIDRWILRLKKIAEQRPRPLVQAIADFRDMVYNDQVLHATVAAMFAEAYLLRKETPLGEPSVRCFEEFLTLLNVIMTTAPECYQDLDKDEPKPELSPAGFIGFPINALLDWPMNTNPGYDVFANSLVNQQLKKILAYWSVFLLSKDSRYVLVEGEPGGDPIIIPWLSPPAQREMVSVATSAKGEGEVPGDDFASIFNCQPDDEYYGFGNWDEFFIRTFVDGVRPISAPDDDKIIVNACESAPFALAYDVSLSDCFWLKEQPYSLENMLNFDDYAPRFEGGTVYQAFLSALSYHRWHSPVKGVIKRAYVVNGSYYLSNLFMGFRNPDGPDASAADESQPFLTAVATRAVIFIEADNPDIGLMCVIAVGMAEVSSCEITVKAGDPVEKGQQIGMFHFGGSTHCLVFRPGVELDFQLYGLEPGPDNSTNIRVNTAIATLR